MDCVETGKTLELHDLREEKIIYHSQVVVVTKEKPSIKVGNLIDKLLASVDYNAG